MGWGSALLRVVFVLPRISGTPIGALKVVYTIADGLAARGHRVSLVHLGEPEADGPHHWYRHRADVRSLVVPTIGNHFVDEADVVVATSWRVVPQVARFDERHGRKLLFLQDFESYELGTGAVRRAMRRNLQVDWPTIATSHPVRALIESLTGRRCPVVAYAVDTERFQVHVPVNDPSRTLVGFPARQERAKRTGDAVEALGLVRASPREPFDVWSFGAYDSELPEWVTHHASPSDAELCGLYNRTAVFVVPSELEGFGLSGAEAMACGAALVSTRNRGVETYAVDGESALLSPPRDPAALDKTIRRLLHDDGLRHQIALAGSRAVAGRSWEQVTAEFEACLLDAMTTQPGVRARPFRAAEPGRR